MKKILLIAGIAAFSSASAQEKELFNIQQHLQNKMAANKKTAQLNIPVISFTKPMNNSYAADEQFFSYQLSNGDKVITCPMDRMPCVQPDMRQFRTMPNMVYDIPFNYLDKKPQQGQIPNGSLPYPLIVSE